MASESVRPLVLASLGFPSLNRILVMTSCNHVRVASPQTLAGAFIVRIALLFGAGTIVALALAPIAWQAASMLA